METTAKFYSLSYKDVKTYMFALIFVCGNIVLPQLCHLIPGGGQMWLPIYFFTLIAAYKYGLRVGLLTAVLSPLLNNVLFGMPPTHLLPVILIKSSLLAIAGAYVAHRIKAVTLLGIAVAVLFYQLIGVGAEWIIEKDFFVAIQDFRLGIPGMLVQVFGGFVVLKAIAKL